MCLTKYPVSVYMYLLGSTSSYMGMYINNLKMKAPFEREFYK